YYMPPNYPRLSVDPADPRPLGVFLQRFGLGCWSHINFVGTGSLRSEVSFAFSHSRTYFSEPCRHGPYRVPVGQPIPPPNVAPSSERPPLGRPQLPRFHCPAAHPRPARARHGPRARPRMPAAPPLSRPGTMEAETPVRGGRCRPAVFLLCHPGPHHGTYAPT